MMLKHMAERIAQFFYENEVIKEKEDIEVYAYGLEIMFATFVSLIAILVIGILFNQFFSAILFFLAFIPLRSYAGGYHAKTHWGCFLILLLVYACNMALLNFLDSGFSALFILISIICSGLTIFLFAPVDHKNKPLNVAQKARCRRISLIIIGIQVAAVLILLLLHVTSPVLLSFSNGQLAASISLIAAKIYKRKEDKNEKSIFSINQT